MNRPLRPTWLEIDLNVVAGNVRFLRSHAARARLMAVVKADAYGHGAEAVACAALENGAAELGVALVEEGVRLRQAGLRAPILVLGGISQDAAGAVVDYGLAQTVFDLQTVESLARAARKAGARTDVHLKVDTGMGRVGVRDEASLRTLAEAVLAEPALRLAGVFTHFAAADADPGFTLEQNERFEALIASVRRACPDVIVHAANSAAILCFAGTHHDMVRAGIAMYVRPRVSAGLGAGLRLAMRWVTHAVHVKEIPPGETVSYGRTFAAERTTRVMTLPVGYADGYHRAIGNRGWALVRGARAPVIGRVCMDQVMVDVTDIPGTAVGDEAVLLGAQGTETISAAMMGTWCGMIDYEILLSPGARVPRVYPESGV